MGTCSDYIKNVFPSIDDDLKQYVEAIPTLLLPLSVNKELSKRTDRMNKKGTKEIVKSLLETTLQKAEKTKADDNTICMDISDIPSTSTVTEQEIWEKKIELLKQENEQLREKITHHENNEKMLKLNISSLEQEIQKIKFEENKDSLEEKIKLALQHVFSPNQVEIALKKKSKARWTQDELSKAFTLRYFSKRSYIYLRQTLHYPLPGISTLQQWASNIDLTNGVLEDVLRIMGIAGQTKNSLFRTTVLCFDEVKVSTLYEYHKKKDEILGPHQYMQVVMARGLFYNWKQPVYIGFDQKMTRELLENIISCLHEKNYNVVACNSDCGGGNQGLWKELGVTIDKTYSCHPITKKPIYFFADVPHLLKLLRNWFLDHGFILKDGTTILKDCVKNLIETTRSEINACFKLSPLHINVEKTQRQNVKLAAQLFSNTTATALKLYLPGFDKKNTAKVADFFQMVNNWFDVMNSYSISTNIPTKKPYGINMVLQNESLEKMLSTVSEMNCINKKNLQVFQKGIIISTKSLQSLFETLKEEFQIKYILTHRLNQDCLEIFFSQLRTRGGLHDHPSPLNALYRIRMILLGKNPGLVSKHSNTGTSPGLQDEEYLLSSIFKKATLGQIHIDEPIMETEEFEKPILDNESTTSSSSANSSSKEESEKDGLAYIAGYLAKKHKVKYPHLGRYTYQVEQPLHSYSMPSWIQSLSFGGLTQPSEGWTQQVSRMDKYFQKLHKNEFGDKKDIIKKTSDYIAAKVTDVPRELVNSFSRQRIFVRIKFLNIRRDESKSLKRKATIDSVLENSADEFEDSEEVYDAIGAVLHEVSSDKSEDEIKDICNELLNMLRPKKGSKSNGSLKILDGPIHLGAMAENQENNVEEIKSIWVAQRDDTLKVDAKKLEKAQAKLQEKQEKRGKETKTIAPPKLQTATASQVINKKESKLEAKGNNRAQDIRIENFDIAYGDRVLLQGADVTLAFGRRYGLVGRNGLGKSTLLKMISSGNLKIPSHISILHVEQEVIGDDTLALASVLECDTVRQGLIEKEQQISAAINSGSTDPELNTQLSEVYAQLQNIEADKAPAKASIILAGLGFTPQMQQNATETFSGGWRMRLALARALFSRPDLLLLDEPTNMLDIKAIIWLENYLQNWPTTLLVVSHDRNFLDTVPTDILYLHSQRLEPYRGNYEQFEKTKTEKMKNQQREYEAQLQQRQHVQEFIDRFRYNANRAALVQSKIKMLEKMPELKPIVKEIEVILRLPETEPLSPPILQLNEVLFRYNQDRVIFSNVNIGATMESRICIVGDNGAGKTTLLKIIMGILSPTSGTRHVHRNLKFGYFSQHHVDQLDMNANSVELLQQQYPGRPIEEYRRQLGSFGVSGDLALQTVSSLSGGQKSRVAFASMCLGRPNFLVLDEPTNHLDIETIEALGKAINKYTGGVILVSHDERLIRMVTNELWHCSEGTVKSIEGGFDEYRKIVEQELEAAQAK